MQCTGVKWTRGTPFKKKIMKLITNYLNSDDTKIIISNLTTATEYTSQILTCNTMKSWKILNVNHTMQSIIHLNGY